jgi:nucleoside-diphosphate-sugar epimerase
MILVTGATGFVGNALVEKLLSSNYQVRACSRDNKLNTSMALKPFVVNDLSEQIDWEEALQGIDVVIHLAARVHVMNDVVLDPLVEFRKINTDATLKLAKQAASWVSGDLFLSAPLKLMEKLQNIITVLRRVIRFLQVIHMQFPNMKQSKAY